MGPLKYHSKTLFKTSVKLYKLLANRGNMDYGLKTNHSLFGGFRDAIGFAAALAIVAYEICRTQITYACRDGNGIEKERRKKQGLDSSLENLQN